MNYIQHWLSTDGNKEHVLLLGGDRDVWWETPLRDLVAIHAKEYEDAISEWITGHALDCYAWVFGGHSKKVWFAAVQVSLGSAYIHQRVKSGTIMASTALYSRRHILRIVTFLAIGIASLMPILSIVLLSAIQSFNARLGVMALFTFMFCALFGIFTGPKKTELLAASAA